MARVTTHGPRAAFGAHVRKFADCPERSGEPPSAHRNGNDVATRPIRFGPTHPVSGAFAVIPRRDRSPITDTTGGRFTREPSAIIRSSTLRALLAASTPRPLQEVADELAQADRSVGALD